MKRFFFSVVALTITASFVAASDGTKGSSSTGKNGSGSTSSSSSSGGKSTDKKVVDLSSKTQVLDKKVGDSLKIGDAGKSSVNGQNQILSGKLNGKINLQGNNNVAKLPGFKSNPMLHTQLLQKYSVPKALHNNCFFHFDFCWSNCCWMPNHGCCCYWHPYQCCWFFYYEPWCCYIPVTYIETYRPIVVVEQTPVIVNVNNTNTNDNIEPQGPTSLPPGAVTTLPTGVNPNIPAPKQ